MGVKKSEASTTRIIQYLQDRGGSTGKATKQIAAELGVQIETAEQAVKALQAGGWVSKRDEEGRLNLQAP